MNARFAWPKLKALILVFLLLPQIGKCEEVQYEPLSPDVVKDWEEDGAVAGWMCVHRVTGRHFLSGRIFFKTGERANIEDILPTDPAMGFTHSVPAFALNMGEEGLPRLRSPKSPFGLVLTKHGRKNIEQDELEKWIDKLEATGAAEHVVMLRIYQPHVTREVLQVVARLKNLKALSLSAYSPGSDDALRGLAPLENLVYLDLTGSAFHLTGISDIKHLSGLNLRYVNMAGNELTKLALLKELKWLSFQSSWNWDHSPNDERWREDSKAAAALKNLEFLSLSGGGWRIDDAAIAEIAKLSKLRILVCIGLGRGRDYPHNISDSGLKEIQ